MTIYIDNQMVITFPDTAVFLVDTRQREEPRIGDHLGIIDSSEPVGHGTPEATRTGKSSAEYLVRAMGHSRSPYRPMYRAHRRGAHVARWQNVRRNCRRLKKMMKIENIPATVYREMENAP